MFEDRKTSVKTDWGTKYNACFVAIFVLKKRLPKHKAEMNRLFETRTMIVDLHFAGKTLPVLEEQMNVFNSDKFIRDRISWTV